MSITLSRPSYGDGSKWIEIQVQDNNSVSRFLTLRLTYEDFAEMMTGLSYVKCLGEVHGLTKVGKVRETQTLVIEMPCWGNDKELASQLAVQECPEGWTPDCYFGSQSSFYSKEGKYYASCRMVRWVDAKVD